VPTTVYARGARVQNGAEDRTEGDTAHLTISNYYLIAGDYSLEANLDRINEEVHSKGLDRMISALQ
jgi:hypothetical protein